MKLKFRSLYLATLALVALALAAVPDLQPLVLGLLADPHLAGGLVLANAAVGVEMKAVLDAIEAVKSGATERLGELGAKFAEVQARLQHAEQKLDQRGAGGDGNSDATGDYLGPILEKSLGFQALMEKSTQTCRIALPARTFATKAAMTTTSLGADLPGVMRLPGIAVPPQRRLTIRDLLPTLTTTDGSVEYVEETGFTNNAATVAEGALKPQSDLAFALRNAAAVTIAHWAHASKQILADAPQLQLFLETRLRYGLRKAEEAQLLRGSGVGVNLRGLITGATAYAAPVTYASPTRIDVLRLAMAQLEDAELQASGIVLHPNDWTLIDLLKDADGNYIKSNPAVSNVRNLWGVPVVTTTAQTSGDFLLGDFTLAATLFDREQPTLDIATQDSDDFLRNLVKLRVEERVALTINQPTALIKGTFA